ncbi:MAG TPA: iron ABC transporter ATP-binding protein [Ruminococcaceae bacterium]|nr:iron ABC transporter ATP-binding protein [Oscillospiraceae bacterium]
MIQVENLVCGYAPEKPVIGPLSFEIKKGEVVCLIGPNGIGKTTLFKTILGLLKPLSGAIAVGGKDYYSYSAKEFARTVAYVPQSHVPPFPYSVRDVVVMGCNPNMHELSSPGKAEFAFADEKLAMMGIGHLAERDYTEVSGGERQMVMVARALAQNTNLLIMDEPTTHLDYGNEARVLGQVKRLSSMGYTIVMITHVPNHAFLCADKVLAVGKDNYCSMGAPDDILTEEALYALYGIDVQISEISMKRDQRKIKICLPTII